jgi:two-component system copper resistance phosphate regulon response regulator CusR
LFRKVAKRGDKTITLTAKEFALLEFMMMNKGRILSRLEIAQQVWDINFDTDTNVVDVAILRLRKKVDDSFSIKLIHTIRGVGYVLEDRSENIG